MNRLQSVRIWKAVHLSVASIASVFCLAAFSGSAFSALTISSGPTANVTCSAGVCSETAPTAVLNANELLDLLTTSAVRVKAGSAAQDVVFSVPFRWTSANALALDAHRTIEIDRRLLDVGPGALSLTTNDGGSGGMLFFGKQGRVAFRKSSNTLTINGQVYRLARSIAQLAANVAAFPKGFHALARNYDASGDGTYSRVPIQNDFDGTFEGLGNSISNFNLYDMDDNNVALFAALTDNGVLRNVRLLNVNMFSENSFVQFLAPLVAYSSGTVLQCQATGAIRSDFWVTGGGLVALSYGTIQKCFADVDVSGAEDATVGGLVGNAHGKVSDVYALGRVIAGDDADVGGLIGYFIGESMTHGYCTGQVSGGQNARVGGLMGENRQDASGGSVNESYWDVTTSGINKGTGFGDTSNIQGVSTPGLTSGIPLGFDGATWAERKQVNSAFPYLIANPPKSN